MGILRFRMVPDSSRWTIDSSSTFTVKSMIDDFTSVVKPFDFYSIIWMDHFPKKIKNFLWKLSHKAIITVIVSIVVCLICLFLLLGVFCVVLLPNPFAHLFIHCPFSRQFWDLILEAFGWSTALSNDISGILNSFRVGHLFIGCKKVIWLAVLQAFFWSLWGEGNRLLFQDSFIL